MRLDILFIRSKLFLSEKFRYQTEFLGDLGKHFCTLDQDDFWGGKMLSQ